MHDTSDYRSPLGGIVLAADEIGLTGLWFEGQKYFALRLDPAHEKKDLPMFSQAKRWLDLYFSGKEPDFQLPLHFTGTPFQNEVWALLYAIPYGQTTTYGAIARQLAEKKGLRRMSARRWAAPLAAIAFHRRSLSSRRRRKREPDRLCRRHRPKNPAAQAGRRAEGNLLYPPKKRAARKTIRRSQIKRAPFAVVRKTVKRQTERFRPLTDRIGQIKASDP
jgi:methylated-DNA-[protein]-cysteine S-methyltransferase